MLLNRVGDGFGVVSAFRSVLVAVIIQPVATWVRFSVSVLVTIALKLFVIELEWTDRQTDRQTYGRWTVDGSQHHLLPPPVRIAYRRPIKTASVYSLLFYTLRGLDACTLHVSASRTFWSPVRRFDFQHWGLLA